jgi:hypothetical protein
MSDKHTVLKALIHCYLKYLGMLQNWEGNTSVYGGTGPRSEEDDSKNSTPIKLQLKPGLRGWGALLNHPTFQPGLYKAIKITRRQMMSV